VQLDQQAITRRLDRGKAKRPELVGVRDRLEQWRNVTIAEEERAAKERPAAFDANYSGSWQATDPPAGGGDVGEYGRRPPGLQVTTTSPRPERRRAHMPRAQVWSR